MEFSSLAVGITFILYILGMFSIGIIAYRKTDTIADYLLGGRKMGAVVSALSASASDMSGWLLMGLPAAAYASGTRAGWIAIGLLIGTYLNWLFVAKRLRSESEKANDSLTLSDFFENVFNDKTHMLRLVTAIVILLFFMIYTASGLVAGGKLFHVVFGMDYRLAVSLGVFAVILYTFFGGFIAVCWTDAIQGFLMIAALIAVPCLAIHSVGGLAEAKRAMLEVSPHMLNMFKTNSGETSILAIINDMAWGLGYFGMPHILVRFMAIESPEKVKSARRVATTWVGISLFAAVVIGCVGIASKVEGINDGEKIFMILVQSLFHPIPAGICLAAVLAAIMSTTDSQLLVCSSVITEDIYRTFFRRDATQKELIWVGRIAVVAIALIAMLVAFDENSKVMDLVSYAWAGFGAAFGPLILCILFRGKQTSYAGALAGIISGGVAVVVWKKLSGGVFDLYEIIPGFILSFVAIQIFSALFPRREEEREEA